MNQPVEPSADGNSWDLAALYPTSLYALRRRPPVALETALRHAYLDAYQAALSGDAKPVGGLSAVGVSAFAAVLQETLRVSQHEAAHAVCAEVLGVRIRAVYLCDEGLTLGGTEVQRTPSGYARRGTLSAHSAICLAGCAWEAHAGFSPDDDWTGSTDVRSAYHYLDWYKDDEAVARESLLNAWQTALRIVSAHSDAVRAVADALIDDGHNQSDPMSRRKLRRLMALHSTVA